MPRPKRIPVSTGTPLLVSAFWRQIDLLEKIRDFNKTGAAFGPDA
jgi:hypothetical protein